MRQQSLFILPVLLFCMLLVLLMGAKTAHAAEYEGEKILRIDIETPSDVDGSRVRETLRMREGDTYSLADVQRDVALVYALGEFVNVEIQPEHMEGGVRVVVRVTPRPKIVGIRFEGDLKNSAPNLQEKIKTKVGDFSNPYRISSDAQALRDFYHSEGYLFAEIQQESRDAAKGIEIVFNINAGSKLRIESVRFEGQGDIPTNDLRAVMGCVKEAGLFSRGTYDETLLRSDLLAVREVVRRRGYLDATVGPEIFYDDAKERAYLVVRVWKGMRYEISKIVVSGTKLFTSEDILAAMELREKEVFSQEQLERDISVITRMYGRKGYIKAKIEPERLFAEDTPSLALRLTIEEGPEVFVNRVIIRGNTRTKDHVIRRDVSLLPGHKIDIAEAEESRRRLLNTGLFYANGEPFGEDPVRIRFLDTQSPELSDVVVEVAEGALGNFQVGASWSSAIGPVGNIQFSLNNFDALDFPESWGDLARGSAFIGGGQKLTLALSPGSRFGDYRLSWLNPSVYDSPYSAGFDVYLRNYLWSGYYDERRVGVSLNGGRTFFKDFHLTLTPRVENVKVSNLEANAPADALKVEGDHVRNALLLAADYDKRDNVFLTSDGYRLGASLELAGTLLGGDSDCVQESIEARRWWTVWNQKGWGKHVVSVGGEVGAMQGVSSDVPIYDRFFIGGVGSIRGFRYRRAGPVDPVVYKQVGGLYLALANVEYEAPLIRDTLRGVVFLDTGVLEKHLSNLNLSRLRASAGVGIRLRLPLSGMQKIPLSLYFSTPVNKEDTDETSAINFTIGTGFDF